MYFYIHFVFLFFYLYMVLQFYTFDSGLLSLMKHAV